MLRANLIDTKGEKAGSMKLSEEIFAAKVNPRLEALAVRVYLANQRIPGARTKTRAEVNRTKAKWYRQKHTGRARHGSKAANIFVGGGVAHGPTGEQNYKLNLSRKMRKAALFSTLTGKLKDKQLVFVSGMKEIKPKTKEMEKIMENLKLKVKNSKTKILVVLSEKADNVTRAARNIEKVDLEQAGLLNAYLVLNHQEIVFMEEAVAKLETVFLKGQK